MINDDLLMKPGCWWGFAGHPPSPPRCCKTSGGFGRRRNLRCKFKPSPFKPSQPPWASSSWAAVLWLSHLQEPPPCTCSALLARLWNWKEETVFVLPTTISQKWEGKVYLINKKLFRYFILSREILRKISCEVFVSFSCQVLFFNPHLQITTWYAQLRKTWWWDNDDDFVS